MTEEEFRLTHAAELKGTKRTQRARRLANERQVKMRGRYGSGPSGETCGHCKHLLGHGGYLKCGFYGVSASESTDWRAKWAACGRFELTQSVDAVGMSVE